MRASLLLSPRQLVLRNVEEAEPVTGDAIARVRAVGICGTDLSIYSGKIPVRLPLVPGHEIAGVIADPGSSELPAGTLVVVDPGLSCGSCTQCREGRTNICTRGGLLGRDADGGLRDEIAVPPTHVFPVPETIDPMVAPLVQVLATCVRAQRLAAIRPGESVVVVGLGVTGLLNLQLAKAAGATRLIGVSRSRNKLELAMRLGADDTVAAEDVEALLRDGDADVAIECAGTVATLGVAVRAARVGGRVLAYGTISETGGPFPYYDLYYKELELLGARSARPQDFTDAIGEVASGRVKLDLLVSARFPLEQASEAFESARRPGQLKVLIDT